MNSQESLIHIVDSVNKGRTIPALSLIKTNPNAAAVISKLNQPKNPEDQGLFNKKSFYQINQSQVQEISDTIKTRINDSKNIIQLFPDIELAIQILVSSILSPKDMVSTQLIYKTSENLLSSELTLKLLGIVESHVNRYYKVKEDLPNILRDTLFETGSHVKLVMPENILDEVVNRSATLSTESLSEVFVFKNNTVSLKDGKDHIVNLGILGNNNPDTKRTALENFTLSGSINIDNYKGSIAIESDVEEIAKRLEPLVDVTDNYNLLKLPNVIKIANETKLKNIIKGKRVSTESKFSDEQLQTLLYKTNPLVSEEFVIIPSRINAKRKAVGRPLVMRLPSESVIPVHVPGDESAHVGYFILVDIDGNPVTLAQNYNSLTGLQAAFNQNQGTTSLSSLLVNRAKRNLMNNDSVPTIDHITKVYGSILEKDLIERLKNGLYKSNLTISNNNEIYRVMLARALANQFTRLVYVPSELTTYFAFRYFENGVGKSYLDSLKVLCSLRAVLLFAKVMAMTKSAIDVTHVNMTLDPRDPDPGKTIEVAMHDITKMRQQYFPLGINSPVDLVDWIQRAGLMFSFEGHPGLPETKFEFENRTLQHTIPDNDLDELLRKQTYMTLGLSPETIDNGFNSEFATTVVANNILLSKRITQLSGIFCEDLSDFIRKIVINDYTIREELKESLIENDKAVLKFLTEEQKQDYSENKDRFLDELLDEFISTITIDLPKPDATSIQTQTAAFDEYVETLDKTLDVWVSSSFVTSDIVGDISSNIDSIKAILRSYFIREWMAENGFMSELNDIVTSDEDGNPTLDVYDINKNHLEGLIKSTLKFIQSLKGVKDAANADINNLGVEPGEEASSFGEGESESTGFDDFGLSDTGEETAGEEENNPEESPPEDENPEQEI